MARLIDTEKLKSLGEEKVRNLSGQWEITYPAHGEAESQKLRVLPADIKILNNAEGPSWNEFTFQGGSNGAEVYDWTGVSSKGESLRLQIYFTKRGLGKKAFCGKHDATIQLSSNSILEPVYLCKHFKENEADLSQITRLLVNVEIEPTYTGDYCLGKSSKKVKKILSTSKKE